MLEKILSDGLGALSIPFTDQTRSDFRKYYTLLSEYSSRMNLTAISGEEDVARLHFLDCASVLSFLDADGKQLLDIGSGAGLPGLVLKIRCPSLNLTVFRWKSVMHSVFAMSDAFISAQRRPLPRCGSITGLSSPVPLRG